MVTNAQRHAHQATRVEVTVTGNATDVQMTVSDDGARTTTAPNPPGFGLIGMTERVALLGGALTAGPNQTAGGASGRLSHAEVPRHDYPSDHRR